MSIKKYLIVTAVFLIAGSGMAWSGAQKQPVDNLHKCFTMLDKDKNGFINKEEAMHDKDLSRQFEKADLNKDGKLSIDEFMAAKSGDRVAK